MEHRETAEEINAYYRRKARGVILKDVLLGMTHLSERLLFDLHIDADIYQVIICEKYSSANQDTHYRFADMLRIANQDNQFYDDIVIDQGEVFLLKGSYAINKFNALMQQCEQEKTLQKWSPLDSFFIASGRCVHTTDEIPMSYSDARFLLERRFFCNRGQHVIDCGALPAPTESLRTIDPELLTEYTTILVNNIQIFSRSGIGMVLSRMQKTLCQVTNPIDDIKLFLIDLYLCIKEKMSHLYPNAHIPFVGNTELIKFIHTRYYLYEILQFFTEQLESMMFSIGHTSRESVLDDVLYYINHNYADNITLDNIAPLFGYNSSYLGRIFSKKMGENFNSYVGRVRIEHAKEMLRQEDTRIYVIAEKVGYRNADYFHIKFKEYVGVSPAEYRKRSRA